MSRAAATGRQGPEKSAPPGAAETSPNNDSSRRHTVCFFFAAKTIAVDGVSLSLRFTTLDLSHFLSLCFYDNSRRRELAIYLLRVRLVLAS